MGKKVFASRKHDGKRPALETPENSFDLPMETSYGLYAGRDRILYSCPSIKEASERNSHSIEVPMKKLISEEVSKRSNTKTNVPSIVARLMGVDMLPVDLGQAPLMAGKKNKTPSGKLSHKEQPEKRLVGCELFTANASPQWDVGLFDDCSDNHMNLRKYKPREHPQEEELQRFKKEFEAWQAARFNECSKVAEFSYAPSQLIAQDELKEKNLVYSNPRRMKTSENLMEYQRKKKDYLLDGVKESLYSKTRLRTESTDILSSKLMSCDKILEAVAAPTKIVILRPGPDRLGVSEDSWSSTPSTFKERGSILDFLEEVKERLNSEMQGTSSRKSTTFQGGEIETILQEKPSDPRQIAQRIAQQARDSVTRDIGMNLLHSESTRSYRSDNGTCSPESINKDSKRLLTDRSRKVLNDNMSQEVLSVSRRRVESYVLDHGKSKFVESKNRPLFRQDPDDGRRQLVRSLSAPVSGTPFGKLLLEDPYVLTGAHIRMKHEVVEKIVKRHKKDKLNIREKVSNFGYGLALGGKLFRRRGQSVDELHFERDDLFKDIASGPTVMMSSYETHENFTEVPPSPASVCSSGCDELWKPSSFTSPSSSSVNQQEDIEIPVVFSQLNPNLNDLQVQLFQIENSVPKIEEQPQENIDDPTKAYIRELLVASGYYDSSWSPSCSTNVPLPKSISNQVFEQVEESYRHEHCKKDEGARIEDRRLILDLLNESLPALFRHPSGTSRTVAWCAHKPLKGQELLSRIWDVVKPADDGSYHGLDKMLQQDLESDSGSGSMDDEINAMGGDIECYITSDLIDDIVKDLHLLA